jgi:hypothetical protein
VTAVSGHPVTLPAPAGALAVSQLTARTGLRLSGQADLCSVDALKQAIAALPPEADEIQLQLPAWSSSTSPRPASSSC